MLDLSCLREDFNPLSKFYQYVKYKIQFMKEHPYYFYPDGLTVFVGPQGSGKTLSAVNYVYNLARKYPKAKIVTNVYLTDFSFDDERVFPFENAEDLSRYNNGELGVIYLIDEIQLYFNSLESKNINPDVMVQISQQRKQRKHIVATSQVFGRMAKPLREQFSNVVVCKNYFKFLQKNQLVDRDSIDESTDDSHISGKVLKTCWYIHYKEYYRRYDTYYTISRTKFISQELKKGDIYNYGSNNVQSNNS